MWIFCKQYTYKPAHRFPTSPPTPTLNPVYAPDVAVDAVAFALSFSSIFLRAANTISSLLFFSNS